MAVLGVDFGTTNSALAVVRDGHAETVLFADPDRHQTGARRHDTWPSVLYFEPAPMSIERTVVRSGRNAIKRYFEAEQGRLIQSLKSFLPVESFTRTSVYGRTYELEDLIAIILTDLRNAGEAWLGSAPHLVVVGRPVHFAAAKNPGEDAFALDRLRQSIQRAGFDDVVFEFEPVAAAYHYEETLAQDELILIGDFGGGTSDFCLMRVGPRSRAMSMEEKILGTDGVGIAGDAFDRQIMRHVVEPQLGRGSSYRSELDKVLPVPQWLYSNFERWHLLSFLKTRETLAFLEQLERQGLEPHKVSALRTIVENEAGYRLYKAVEHVKVALSSMSEARFRFVEGHVAIERSVTRTEFEHWIEEEIGAIRSCVARLLGDCKVPASMVDRVFLTGGSSFIPAVREVFVRLVGSEKILSGDEFTSVARGLARSGQRRTAA